MLKRLFAFSVIAAFVVLALPAYSAEKTAKPAAASAQAAPLSAAHAATLAKLQRLAAPDTRLKLAKGVLPVFKPTTVKKEISCGILVYPPTPNPMAVSKVIYWVNNTGQALQPGVHIEWEIEGNPPACCKGVTTATHQVWPANPPSPVYFTSMESELTPPQPWTRPCKAWVIIP